MKNLIIRNLIILTIVIVPLLLMMVTYFDNRYLKLKSDDGCFVGAFSGDGRQVKINKQNAGYEGYPIYKVCKNK